MKGLVYGGIVKLPSSPHADMNGMVRAIIRTKLFNEVMAAMERLHVNVIYQDLGRTWTVSNSHVEADVTARDYGEVFTCHLALAYLKPENYSHHPYPHATGGKKFGNGK